MRTFRWSTYLTVSLLAAIGFLLPIPARAQLPETLRANRWNKRVVLLYAPTPDDKLLEQQRVLLRQDQSGQQERDMLVLEVLEPQLTTAERRYLRTRLAVPTGHFQVLLIGKDGGIKRREQVPVSRKALFSIIDAMPMRRQEMLR